MIRFALACVVLAGCVHFPSYRELVSRPAQPPQRVLIRDVRVHLTYTGAPPWYPVLPKPEHNAQAHVYAGVTTVLDMGGDPSEILALKKKIAAGELAGPRIFFSGWHLTVPGG